MDLNLCELAWAAIRRSPYQVRKHFDPVALQDLAASIARDRQLQPIVVRRVGEGYELIAGERRWRAAQLLDGQATVLALVVEASDLQARRMLAAENVQREDLSALEWVEAVVNMVDAELLEDEGYAAFGECPLRRVQVLLSKLDADRRHGTDHVASNFTGTVERLFAQLPKPMEWVSFYTNDLPLLTKLAPEVQDLAIRARLSKSKAEALGELRKKAPRKFRQVVKQGGVRPRQDLADWTAPPDEVRPLSEVSARELKEVAARQQLQDARRTVAPVETPPLPAGTYRCLVIDPPWPMEYSERLARPTQGDQLPYAVMSLEAIEALPVPTLIPPDGCHVYLWVTQRFLPAGLRCLAAWGVTYQCVLTWEKPSGMTPYSWMYNTEHVLFGRVGGLGLEAFGRKLSFHAPATRHSAKPEVFYRLVRDVSPGPRVELFAREPRQGFRVWGHEVRDAIVP